MASVIKPGWSKPSTILFASEIPANEKAFAFALAQASEFGADLIVFHAYDTLVVAASETSGIRYYDYAAAARAEMQHLEPLAQRVRAAGIRCEVVVRPGLPADQILAFLREREIDRIVMGTHSPGPIGKLLVGSVAEAVLRTARVPVYIVGPEVVSGDYRKFATRTILCAVSLQEASHVVAGFAAELAAQHNARLILQHVIRPQERLKCLPSRSIDQIEADLLGLVPTELHGEDCGADHRGAGRPDRGTALSGPSTAGRPDCAGRARGVGLCGHHAARRGLQGAGARALPGHHAFAGGAGAERRACGSSCLRGLYGWGVLDGASSMGKGAGCGSLLVFLRTTHGVGWSGKLSWFVQSHLRRKKQRRAEGGAPISCGRPTTPTLSGTGSFACGYSAGFAVAEGCGDAFAFSDGEDAVLGGERDGLLAAGRPVDFGHAGVGGVAQSEVQTAVVGGDVAAAGEHVLALAHAVGLEVNGGAGGVAGAFARPPTSFISTQ